MVSAVVKPCTAFTVVTGVVATSLIAFILTLGTPAVVGVSAAVPNHFATSTVNLAVPPAYPVPSNISSKFVLAVPPSINKSFNAARRNPMVGPRHASTPVAFPVNQPTPSVSLLMDTPPLAGISIEYMPLLLTCSVQS